MRCCDAVLPGIELADLRLPFQPSDAPESGDADQGARHRESREGGRAGAIWRAAGEVCEDPSGAPAAEVPEVVSSPDYRPPSPKTVPSRHRFGDNVPEEKPRPTGEPSTWVPPVNRAYDPQGERVGYPSPDRESSAKDAGTASGFDRQSFDHPVLRRNRAESLNWPAPCQASAESRRYNARTWVLRVCAALVLVAITLWAMIGNSVSVTTPQPRPAPSSQPVDGGAG